MYHFFLNTMQLPVPPAKMSIKRNGKNKTINLINEGEASIIKEQGLQEVSFNIRLPNSQYPWANYDNSLKESAINFATSKIGVLNKVMGGSFNFKDAKYFLEQIETMKNEKKPVRFIVSRMTSRFRVLFFTNILVTIEDYSIDEDAGKEGTDLVIPIKLREYRPFETKTATIQTDENGNKKLVVNKPRPADDKVMDNVIKVVKDATIWEAVQAAAGGKLDWRAVANTNAIDNPFQKLKGKVLKL